MLLIQSQINQTNKSDKKIDNLIDAIHLTTENKDALQNTIE